MWFFGEGFGGILMGYLWNFVVHNFTLVEYMAGLEG